MVGGMPEYSALLIGYRHLLLLVILFYAISALLRGGGGSTLPKGVRQTQPRLQPQNA
jgi:hypothetical protein